MAASSSAPSDHERQLTIALGQLSIDAGAVATNRRHAEEVIEDAAGEGADLVVLPELFHVGYFVFDAWQSAAEPLEGPTLSGIASAASEYDVAVLAGTIVEDLAATESAPTPASQGLANSAVLVDATGERQLVYRKHHLFGHESEERDRLVAGERLETASLSGVTVGVATCFDLRFPDLFGKLRTAGAELVLVPSAWPAARPDHWEVLSRARAIENQYVLAAVNGAGHVAGTELLGESVLWGPWGKQLDRMGTDPEMGLTSVDFATVDRVRESFPLHER